MEEVKKANQKESQPQKINNPCTKKCVITYYYNCTLMYIKA